MKKKEAVIFGAGQWGRLAYYYYKESCDIVYYIDNDQTIWGTRINGIPVCSPDILRNETYTVLIANKRFEEEIKRQLLQEYNIQSVITFRIHETMQELYHENACGTDRQNLIVAFSHGLGNQMFQYALYRLFVKQGKNVSADLSAYIKPGMMPFELPEVFPNIRLNRCDPRDKARYLKNDKEHVYIEEPPRDGEKMTYRKQLTEWQYGYIEGFHCSYKYPELIRQELLSDFAFPFQKDRKLLELKKMLAHRQSVSVHIRRGDFMNPRFQREIGNICTEEYYAHAISRIKEKYPDILFCFFSNDMDWVKKNIKEKNVLYIESSMFEEYHDWYDMYLMSICKNNIIPNSTFGWWGAWLNQNPDKTVIAPKKWRTRWEAKDWCPPDWCLIPV